MCFFFSVFVPSFRHHFISPRLSFRSLVYILSIHFSLGSLTFSSTYFISLIYSFPLSFLCTLYSLILSILSNFLLFHIFLSMRRVMCICNMYMYVYVYVCMCMRHRSKCVGKVVGCAYVCGRIRWILPHDWVYTIK